MHSVVTGEAVRLPVILTMAGWTKELWEELASSVEAMLYSKPHKLLACDVKIDLFLV